jgi:hypothetical protein
MNKKVTYINAFVYTRILRKINYVCNSSNFDHNCGIEWVQRTSLYKSKYLLFTVVDEKKWLIAKIKYGL